jgi:hypothetical protein
LLQGSDERRARMCSRMPGMQYQGGRMTYVRTLAAGIDGVRDWFNDKSAYARLVAIQSST